MSITDELREWSKNWSETNRVLDEIADRIDEAHEAGVEAAEYKANYDAFEGIKNDYIELPKDRNGKAIHVGALLTTLSGGNDRRVERISFDTKWNVQDYDGVYLAFQERTIVEPDTQEKIDADAKKICCEYWGKPQIGCDDCTHSSHQSGISCERNMLHDILRRQRELDGVR